MITTTREDQASFMNIIKLTGAPLRTRNGSVKNNHQTPRMANVFAAKAHPSSDEESYSSSTGLWHYIPYFRKPENVLLFKLDCLLLTWTFIAGILKEMDQSATTQAYVSGMKESLSLYGNELVNFNTFFSVGYAIGLIPGQLIQTKVSSFKMPNQAEVANCPRFALPFFFHSVKYHGAFW